MGLLASDFDGEPLVDPDENAVRGLLTSLTDSVDHGTPLVLQWSGHACWRHRTAAPSSASNCPKANVMGCAYPVRRRWAHHRRPLTRPRDGAATTAFTDLAPSAYTIDVTVQTDRKA
jgi:hypothetical protein